MKIILFLNPVNGLKNGSLLPPAGGIRGTVLIVGTNRAPENRYFNLGNDGGDPRRIGPVDVEIRFGDARCTEKPVNGCAGIADAAYIPPHR